MATRINDLESSRVVFAGSGTTGPFSLVNNGQPIYFTDDDHIHAAKMDANGIITPLQRGSHYDLTGGPSAGKVTLYTNLAVGEKLALWRRQPQDQVSDFDLVDDFSSTTHNLVADKDRAIDQELQEQLNRCLKLGKFADTATDTEVKNTANTVIGFDTNGNPIPISLTDLQAHLESGGSLGVQPINKGGTGEATTAAVRKAFGLGFIVKSATTTTPPAVVDGEHYLIPATGATGVWADHANKIAFAENGVYTYLTPEAGWTAYAVDTSLGYFYTGTVWKATSSSSQNDSDTQESFIVISNTVTTPPTIVNGEHYLIPATGATGVWADHANKIAFAENDAWTYKTPSAGWTAHIKSTGKGYVYIGTAWKAEVADTVAEEEAQTLFVVESATTKTPPGSVTNGEHFLVPSGGTGDWADQANKIAFAENDAFTYKTPTVGWVVYAKDTQLSYFHDGTGWTVQKLEGLDFDGLDGRVVQLAQTNDHSGDYWNALLTNDGRIQIYGDQALLGYEPAGDNWGPFEADIPWDTDTVTVEKIKAGPADLYVLTDEATGNAYHMGLNDVGQGGHGTTTVVRNLTRIEKFATDGVKISDVKTSQRRGGSEKFAFFLTTTGRAYGVGYSGAQHVMGYNNTANLSTPRKLTWDDGTTEITGISEIVCSTIYTPVWLLFTAGTCARWGAGTDGAHGNGTTTVMTWPEYLGGAVDPRTGITAVVTTGYSSRAASAIIVSGKIEVCGNRLYGIGDGAAEGSADQTAFVDATGDIANETISQIVAGGGDVPVFGAIDSNGYYWQVGYGSAGIHGDGTTNHRQTFFKPTLPTGYQGNVRKALIAGAAGSEAVYIEADVSGNGVRKLCAIGKDTHYATAKNTTGVAAASQTFSECLGQWGKLTDWQVFGEHTAFSLITLDDNGEARFAGYNGQGQGGVQPGNLHSVTILQPVNTGRPRIIKPPTFKGDYSAAVTYHPNDIVFHDGSSWVNIATSTGVAPPTLPTTSNSNWKIFVKKGDGVTNLLTEDIDGAQFSIHTVTNTYKTEITAATYTLLATDTGNVLTFNSATDQTVTVPNSLKKGFSCTVMQLGDGQVIFVAGSGAAVDHRSGHDRTFRKFSMAILAVYENAGSAAKALLSGDTASS